MKLPRDISGNDLAKSLSLLGYEISNQTGSHMRLTTQHRGEHHITIPVHDTIRVGTLNAILQNVAEHHKMNREELLDIVFS